MPIDKLSKIQLLVLLHNCLSRGSLQLIRPTKPGQKTNMFLRANNCRGERSLLTTVVNLWNTHLQGEEPGEPLSLQDLCLYCGRAVHSGGWWALQLVGPNAGGIPSTYQSHGCLASLRLSDHTATVFSAILLMLCFIHTHVETVKDGVRAPIYIIYMYLLHH